LACPISLDPVRLKWPIFLVLGFINLKLRVYIIMKTGIGLGYNIYAKNDQNELELVLSACTRTSLHCFLVLFDILKKEFVRIGLPP